MTFGPADDDTLCVPISDAHALAVGRAASMFGITQKTVGDLPAIFDRIWAGWETIHQTQFAGGTATLLRHPASGEWACPYVRTGDPLDEDYEDENADNFTDTAVHVAIASYDFSDWEFGDARTRRTMLTQHTLTALTGQTPTALVDWAVARALAYTVGPSGTVSDPTVEFFDSDAAFAPRGTLAVAAVVYTIVTADHPDTAEVSMLVGLGGYEDVASFIECMTQEQEGRWLTEQASAAYSAAVHAGRTAEMHTDGDGYQCWACTFVNSRIMGYDSDFDAEQFWDRDIDGPNESFGDELNERIASVMGNWVDDDGFHGQHGVSPQRMLDAVFNHTGLSFYETVNVLLADWERVFVETTTIVSASKTSLHEAPTPVTVIGWRKDDTHNPKVAVSFDVRHTDPTVWEQANVNRRLFTLSHYLDQFMVSDDVAMLYADFNQEVSALCDKDADAYIHLLLVFERNFPVA